MRRPQKSNDQRISGTKKMLGGRGQQKLQRQNVGQAFGRSTGDVDSFAAGCCGGGDDVSWTEVVNCGVPGLVAGRGVGSGGSESLLFRERVARLKID